MYADRKGLAEDVAEAFCHIIRGMDSEYLKWKKAKEDALKPKGKKHGRFQR